MEFQKVSISNFNLWNLYSNWKWYSSIHYLGVLSNWLSIFAQNWHFSWPIFCTVHVQILSIFCDDISPTHRRCNHEIHENWTDFFAANSLHAASNWKFLLVVAVVFYMKHYIDHKNLVTHLSDALSR